MKKIKGVFMKLGKAIRVFLFIGALLSVLIGTAALFAPTTVYAIINRAVGPTTIPGWGILLDNDSTEVNITQVWTDSLWKMVFQMVDSTDAVIDSAVGAERAAVAGKADSALAFTHGGIKDWHIDWGSGAGQVNLDDFDDQTAWRVFYSNTDGDVTELALGANGTYLKSNGATSAPSFGTPPGGDPGSAINDSITYGYQIYQKIDTTTALDFDQFCDGFDNFFLRTGSDAVTEITVYDNLANDSVGHFARHIHTGTTAGKIDTIVTSNKLPMGMDANGVDSVTYNIRTSHVADSVYVQVKVWKRTTELGALVFCDSVAATATTTGAWEHKTTGALEVAANAGNELEVWFIMTFPSQTANIVLAEHSEPKPWYTGR